MSKFKISAFIALISLAFGTALVGDALAGERGKVVSREVYFATSIPSAKVPDVEGHAIYFFEAKGIGFSEEWGAALITLAGTGDYTKGAGPNEGYSHFTYADGSTITLRWKGKAKEGPPPGTVGRREGDGTWTYIKGTGKFEGIKGGGTYKYFVLGPGQWYSDGEGEYTLP